MRLPCGGVCFWWGGGCPPPVSRTYPACVVNTASSRPARLVLLNSFGESLAPAAPPTCGEKRKSSTNEHRRGDQDRVPIVVGEQTSLRAHFARSGDRCGCRDCRGHVRQRHQWLRGDEDF